MLTAFKSLSTVSALWALSVLILSCSQTPDPNDVVKRLPELPPELAANLTSTKIDNVLMTKDPPKVQQPLAPPPLEACDRKCTAYVSYPMTICFPPGQLPDREWETAGAQVEALGWSPAAQPAPRYYKLSKPTGLPHLLCRVTNGPWLAKVDVTESCDGGADSILEIRGAPQLFSVGWVGGISGIPPPFNPQAFACAIALDENKKPKCKCCGVTCDDGRCVRLGSSCDTHP
jgi:hypothetical protein